MSHGADRERCRYRAQVLSRVVAAIGGGYLFSMAAAVAVTYALPLPLGEALMAATMLSYALYLVAVLWVFSTGSAKRAWIGVAVGTGVLAGVAFVLHSATMAPLQP